MTEHVQAWQCIGCGRIEAPQTCIGVCQDRKVGFVYADEHQRLLAYNQRLESLIRRLAWATPRDNGWERSYRVFTGGGAAPVERQDGRALPLITALSLAYLRPHWSPRTDANATTLRPPRHPVVYPSPRRLAAQ